MPADPASPSGTEPAAPSAAFVLCIENNETRGQALLLIESLRAFGGRYSGSEVLAVAPRPGLGVDEQTRARLDELEATYHEAPLNTACPEYGSANRVYAAAWAARHCRADTLFVLDSDTLFLGEPEALGPECDLAVRPVDVKGATSEGPGDPFEPYWAAVCELADMAIGSLPFVETTLDRRRVRASYNGGYCVVRRASGILERAAELFTRSVVADLRPYKGIAQRIFASTGEVGLRASEYWGSNQAALSIAAWSMTRRIRLLDRHFNVPLHGLAEAQYWTDDWAQGDPRHLHYHWLLRSRHRDQAFATMAKIGVSPDRLEWIRDRAGLIEPAPDPIRARPAARPNECSRQLVITGMHRSGTSLVASVLQQAGLDLGPDLMGPAPGNWRGHFEDRDFHALHEAMLAARGVSPFSAGASFAPPLGVGFEERARQLVESRAHLDLWGFKDPRACLFLDFWAAELPALNYLFLYRHPVEVAHSLRRRATDPEIHRDPGLAIRAWEVHNRRLLAFVERHPERCFLAAVPALTADLPGFVRRVAAKLDLALSPSAGSALFAPAELGQELATEGVLPAWEELLPEALALYGQLERRADLPSRTASREDRQPQRSGAGEWRLARWLRRRGFER